MKSIIDIFFKPIYRFFRFPEERRRFWRELEIRSKQDLKISEDYSQDCDFLIVFLLPGADRYSGKDPISGGMLSIASLFEESRKLDPIQTSCTIMMTFPDEYLFFEFTSFRCDANVFRFSQLFTYFKRIRRIVLHIPEMYVGYFLPSITKFELGRIRQIEDVQINILNQNIRLMPEKGQIDDLRVLTQNVTITTAHVKYCTRAYRDFFGAPLHFFSTFASPENYQLMPYTTKRNLMILSPDDPKKNDLLISKLAEKDIKLEIKVIRNLKYEEYKELISAAKWSVTFGEGLDFYFIEPVFSGAISFAIYNDQFFTPDFSSLRTVYHSFDELLENLSEDIGGLDSQDAFSRVQKEEFELCAKYYSKEQYRKNIAAFYRREYTYA